MTLLLAADAATAFSLPTALLTAGAMVLGAILTIITDKTSQKRLFEHRLRLEKEYELYMDLWDKLFELRRAVGSLVKPLVQYNDSIEDAFNPYQAAVRRGEPFMATEVYEPAREIVKLARNIIGNVGKQQRIAERREKGLGAEADEELADEQIALNDKSEEDFEQVERLFEEVAQAIRRRVRP